LCDSLREWQQREHEADEDLTAGRVTRHESDEQFLAALDERRKLSPTFPVMARWVRAAA
jgi:hypothetical protein